MQRCIFNHICGHVGFGPGIHFTPTNVRLQISFHFPIPPASLAAVETFQLPINAPCPWCQTTMSLAAIEHGKGIIATLTPPYLPTHQSDVIYLDTWTCVEQEIEEREWQAACDREGEFKLMAWIPKPCGDVRFEGSGEMDSLNTVSSSWRQSLTGRVESRFAGMLSELNARRLNGWG